MRQHGSLFFVTLGTVLIASGPTACYCQKPLPSIPASGYTTPDHYDGWKLAWSDEFEGESIGRKWSFQTGDGCPDVCGWGNNELQYYREENAWQSDGRLIIEAIRESSGSTSYTSARIITRDHFSFTYGRVDVRALLPKGQGIWPAVWMLGTSIGTVGWPACGEIDIIEMIGGNGRERTVYGTAHWDNEGEHASHGDSHTLAEGDYTTEFHVYSVVWDKNSITWYVDDRAYHTLDTTPAELGEFRQEFFIILNLAVGGNWPGNPDGTTIFPQRLIVDYVRVFQDE